MIEIVGGGLIGLSCAWELGRRGIEATVFERESGVEHAASWAGAGMLAAHGEVFPDELWRGRGVESAGLYERWVADIGGAIDFVAPGVGVDGLVDPRDLLRELSRQVQVERREVRDLSELTGEGVVVAAGAWAGEITVDGAKLPASEPVKGYLVAWRGVAGLIEGILRDGPTYIFQRSSGLVIAGSTEERIGFAAGFDAMKLAELRLRALDLLPSLRDLDEVDAWYGFRPGTRDDVPVVRRWDERVVLAYGHYRNGILLAPWTARWVADEVQRQLGK